MVTIMSGINSNSLLGLALYFTLSISHTCTMDQEPVVFKKITRQNGLIALDNVRELHLNMERRKSNLPSTLVAELQEAVGSRSVAQVDSIVRNLNAYPFPFTSDVTVSDATSQIALEKLVTVILSLRINNVELANEVFHRILAQCPELIHDHRLFACVLPTAIESHCLDIYIPQFPLLWFKRYCTEREETRSCNAHLLTISESAAVMRFTEILAVVPLTLRKRFSLDTQSMLKDTLCKQFTRLLITRHHSI